MTSKQSVPPVDVVSAPAGKLPRPAVSSQTKLHEEDGWIFSERPGIGVTCLCRSGELPRAHAGQRSYPGEY